MTSGQLHLFSAFQVSAKVSSLSSHITLDQTFLNAFDAPLEATYIFPLPSRAAVTSFRLEVKDRVVEGIIKGEGGGQKGVHTGDSGGAPCSYRRGRAGRGEDPSDFSLSSFVLLCLSSHSSAVL
jgi:hypothetical protein